MLDYSKHKTRKLLAVGLFQNRNWILGNWINEVVARVPDIVDSKTIFSIYAKKRIIEKLLQSRVSSQYGSYFFAYPTIFQYFLTKTPEIAERSMVLFPHYESEMGTKKELAKLLQQAQSVFFFCSRDIDVMVENGLSMDKCRLAMCAVDLDCSAAVASQRIENRIVLASRFGPRKGLDKLPEIVRRLSNYEFVALGRGWDEFVRTSGLSQFKNFKYVLMSRETRNREFPKSSIFLSLSSLEGGPVPLIEALSLGLKPVVTDTGFARDVICDSNYPGIIPVQATVGEIINSIEHVSKLRQAPMNISKELTWDRITDLMLREHYQIIAKAEMAKGLGV